MKTSIRKLWRLNRPELNAKNVIKTAQYLIKKMAGAEKDLNDTYLGRNVREFANVCGLSKTERNLLQFVALMQDHKHLDAFFDDADI